jgi:SOS response regulatory protein OraA/RecX
MPKGPLRLALEDFMVTSPAGEWVTGYRARFNARHSEMQAIFSDIKSKLPLTNLLFTPQLGAASFLYVVLGLKWYIDFLYSQLVGGGKPSASSLLGEVIREVFGLSVFKEIAQYYGALIIDPALAVLEDNAGDDGIDPKDRIRRMLGLTAEINLASALVDGTMEALGAGQLDFAGRLGQNVIEGVDLQGMSREAINPLLRNAVQPPMDRFYRRKYRPQRFTAGNIRDLFALGKADIARVYDVARSEGWREEDIQSWVDLAYRELNEGTVWSLYHEAHIDQAETVRRLRIIGYRPDDMPLLFKANQRPDFNDNMIETVQLARLAFRDGLLSETDFRRALRDLDRTNYETDLYVAVEKKKQLDRIKSLTQGQIKQAWSNNVLSDGEAHFWLAKTGIGDEEIALLLETWKAEVVPVFLKTNKGTITGAFVEGILDRTRALDWLLRVGLDKDSANLELDLAQARNPSKFGLPQPKPQRTLSPAILVQLVAAGKLSLDQMRQRLTDQGYTDVDAQLLTDLAQRALAVAPRELSQGDIIGAYVDRILSHDQARGRLEKTGLITADANLLLDKAEKDHPDNFGTTAATATRLLSPGQLTEFLRRKLITPAEMRQRLIDAQFSDGDADLFVQLAQIAATPATRQLGQGGIERAYVSEVIDRATAQALLKDLDFSDNAIMTILDTVEAQNPAVFAPSSVQAVRQPSVAALSQAVQNGLIDENEFFARMAELGYDRAGASIFLSLASGHERKSTKTLTLAQIQEAYKRDFYSRGVALQKVTEMGYNDADATLLLRFIKSGIEETEPWSSMLSGLISSDNANQQLLDLGFTTDEIDKAFTQLAKESTNATTA